MRREVIDSARNAGLFNISMVNQTNGAHGAPERSRTPLRGRDSGVHGGAGVNRAVLEVEIQDKRSAREGA